MWLPRVVSAEMISNQGDALCEIAVTPSQGRCAALCRPRSRARGGSLPESPGWNIRGIAGAVYDGLRIWMVVPLLSSSGSWLTDGS